ncbi:MAG: putative acetyltransferase [Sphingomonas bacterium]|nr:putative acetyltransferase [Sphingomonas bacterium]
MKGLMLRHAFGAYDTVVFRIGDENWRSRRAVEKIGGVLTDRVQEVTMGDAVIRHVSYAIAKHEFAAGPLGQAPTISSCINHPS